MGGNSSYNKNVGYVPDERKTHIDTGYTICGYKVLLCKKNEKQLCNILNSNSRNALYLIAKRDKNGSIHVFSINDFNEHDIYCEVNLKFDKDWNFIPFSPQNSKSSHAHYWKEIDESSFMRIKHDKDNIFNIPPKFNDLIKGIEEFNKKNLK